MGAYAIGILTGIVMCMVAMLVRCVVWYGKKHPEDDYWHRIPPEEERMKGVDDSDGIDCLCGDCGSYAGRYVIRLSDHLSPNG